METFVMKSKSIILLKYEHFENKNLINIIGLELIHSSPVSVLDNYFTVSI